MTEVGTAFVTILPSAKGFGTALATQATAAGAAAGRQGSAAFATNFTRDANGRLRDENGKFVSSGEAGGKKFGGGFATAALPSLKLAGGALAALAIVDVARDAVKLEAAFSQTMNTMAAVANVPQNELRQLSDLALKMGADTSFSANEAADAMLELAKGGISPANIQAGALQGTLTLAAAGGTDLATAATIASNALNTFSLSGSDMNTVAAALAGGANASSASVQSLGEALGQVGPGATTAGLSLQQTVGVLSAFDAAGIKGSDAGTSLKTMLTRLVPTTKASAAAMAKLGLDFTDANGKFVPITNVAEQLRTKLSGLSDEQRTTALSTIFGSDATRAATVLMKEGAKGIEGYVAAASDMEAANRVAAARTSGTAGALERMSGSIETAKLGLGRLFAPAIVAGADLIGKGANAAAKGVDSLLNAFKGGGGGTGVLDQLMTKMTDFGATLTPIVREGAANLQALGRTAQEFGAALLPTLTELGNKFTAVLGPAIREIGQMFTGQLLPAFQAFLPAVRPVVDFLIQIIGGALVGALQGAVNVIKGVLNVIIGVIKLFTSLLTGNWRGAWDALVQIVSGIFRAIIGAVQVALNVGVLRIFKVAGGAIKGIWSGLWNGIKAVATGVMNGVRNFISGAVTRLVGLFRGGGSGILSVFRSAFNAVRNVVTSVIGGVRSFISGALSTIGGIFRSVVGGYIGIVRGAFNAIKAAISAALATARAVVSSALGAIRGAFSAGFAAARGVVSAAMGAIKGAVTRGIGNVVSFMRGLPGKITGALGNAGSMLSSTGRNIVEGLIGGIKAMAGQAIEAAKAMVSDALNAAKSLLGIASPSKAFAQVGKFVVTGFAQGIRGNTDQATAAAKRLAELTGRAFKNAKGGMPNVIKAQNKQLAALIRQRNGLTTRLEAAREGLRDLRETAKDTARGIRDNILGGADITRGGDDEDADRSAGGIVARLQESLRAAQQFRANVEALRARGLNEASLRQLLEAGVEGGKDAAAALVAGSAEELSRINVLQGQLDATATATGRFAADTFYGAGIKAAEGLIKGLADKEDALEDRIMALAKRMEAAIKRALGIRSPSKVFRNIGLDTGRGLAEGLVATRSLVADAGRDMASAAIAGSTLRDVPRVRLSSVAGIGVRGGDGVSINVNNPVLHEQVDIDMLTNALAFEARAGGFGA